MHSIAPINLHLSGPHVDKSSSLFTHYVSLQSLRSVMDVAQQIAEGCEVN